MNDILSETQTITSRQRIKEIFDTFFIDKPVYLKYGKKDIRVKCYSCINGKVMAGIPFVKVIPDPVIIYSSIGNKIINLHLKKTGRAEFDVTYFDVIKCTLIVPARSFERYKISHNKDHRKVAYITGFITETILENSLMFESKKIGSIFNYAETELRKHFSSVRFLTKNVAQNDIRMQYVAQRRRGIVVKKLNDESPEDREGYDFYMKNIFSREKSVKSGSLPFSEAVIPLTYRNKIPYGYLSITKEITMSKSDLTLAENFVKSIEQFLLKQEVFPVVPENIIVNEVSLRGMSVLQYDKKNLRHFKIGNQFCCDLVFPENKKIHLLSRIRHNSPDGDGVVRTGFEIEKIDDNHIQDFKDYVGSFEKMSLQL
jgi:hypothetical protein